MLLMHSYRSENYPPAMPTEQADSHWLGVIIHGHGTAQIGERTYPLAEGDGLLIDQGAFYAIVSEEPMQISWIGFDDLIETVYTKQERHYYRRSGTMPCYGLLPARRMPAISDLVQQIEKVLQDPPERQRNRPDVLFQQLAYLLTEPMPVVDESFEAVLSRVMDYVEAQHGDTLSRDRLAEVAGLSPWYFSHQFKKWQGITPMEYVHQVRIRHAKELMILYHCSIREAGERSGYPDEAYFRKKFKQSVGITPAAYRKEKLARIASLSYTYTSHLLTLGIVPLAALVDPKREAHRQEIHPAIPVHLRREIFREDALFSEDFDRLEALQPSLILGDNLLLQEQTGAALAKIAPCHTVPWLEQDWRSHFLHIAALVEREEMAKAWLDDYDRLVAQVRQQLSDQLDGGKRTLLLRVSFGQLSVFGDRNVGAVLYNDLGLDCPYDRHAISIEQAVEASFLLGCNPDYLLVAMDNSPASQMTYAQLALAQWWSQLPAVRQQRVYRVQEYPWLEYSPEAHRQIVKQIQQQLVHIAGGK